MASCWKLSKHLNKAPTFHIHVNKLVPTKILDLQPLWMRCSWTSLEFLRAPKPAYALVTWTKVKLSWLIPSCCICWKSCITFSGCPPFHIFCKLLLPCKNVPGAIAAISAGTHGEFWVYSSQSASCVFLCLKFKCFSFVYNQKSRSSWSAMYTAHPRHKQHHRNRESCNCSPPSAREVCHSILHLFPVLQPTTTILPLQRIWEEFLPKFRP
jgi:hypothetical protein